MRKAWCDICGEEISDYDVDINKINLTSCQSYEFINPEIHKEYDACEKCFSDIYDTITNIQKNRRND